jgi:hypothetical protein
MGTVFPKPLRYGAFKQEKYGKQGKGCYGNIVCFNRPVSNYRGFCNKEVVGRKK